MIGKTIGEYQQMFKMAKTLGTKIGNKNNTEVYKIVTQIEKPLKNGNVLTKKFNYLASFRDGKPFKIVDSSNPFDGKNGKNIYNDLKNVTIETKHVNNFYRRTIKNANTQEIKGQLDLYVGNDRHVNFMAINTPNEGLQSGLSLDNGYTWNQNGTGFSPYDNIRYYLKEFNKKVNS